MIGEGERAGEISRAEPGDAVGAGLQRFASSGAERFAKPQLVPAPASAKPTTVYGADVIVRAGGKTDTCQLVVLFDPTAGSPFVRVATAKTRAPRAPTLVECRLRRRLAEGSRRRPTRRRSGRLACSSGAKPSAPPPAGPGA